jgi:hypothetical protein
MGLNPWCATLGVPGQGRTSRRRARTARPAATVGDPRRRSLVIVRMTRPFHPKFIRNWPTAVSLRAVRSLPAKDPRDGIWRQFQADQLTARDLCRTGALGFRRAECDRSEIRCRQLQLEVIEG